MNTVPLLSMFYIEVIADLVTGLLVSIIVLSGAYLAFEGATCAQLPPNPRWYHRVRHAVWNFL